MIKPNAFFCVKEQTFQCKMHVKSYYVCMFYMLYLYMIIPNLFNFSNIKILCIKYLHTHIGEQSF